MTRYWICERHHDGTTTYIEYPSRASAERACAHMQRAADRSGVPVTYTMVVAEGIPA